MTMSEETRVMLARERAEWWDHFSRWAATRKDQGSKYPVPLRPEEIKLLTDYWAREAMRRDDARQA